jgi:hypothetical protein
VSDSDCDSCDSSDSVDSVDEMQRVVGIGNEVVSPFDVCLPRRVH